MRVRQARTLFFDKGMVSHGLLSGVIERSWLRCQAHGLAVDDKEQNFDPLRHTELDAFRDKNLSLMISAQPIMENLYQQIQNTHSMVILTNSDGLILHSLGDPDFVGKAKRVALQPGISWSEDNKGTNAIGTALVEQSSVLVHGPEHYIAANNFLTCSASPIADPHGRLVGVLDVSGDYRSYQPHTMGVVKMSVQMIENHLFIGEFPDCVSLHFHTHPGFIGTLCEGIAVFAPDGKFMAANRSAQFQLGLLNSEARQGVTFEMLFDMPFTSFCNQARQSHTPLVLRSQNGAKLHIRVHIGSALRSGRIVAFESQLTKANAYEKEFSGEREHALSLDELNLGDRQFELIINKVRKVSGRDIPILIQGETGTGKELLAKAIHAESLRRNTPFIAVNCAAIPEGLIESELFGYQEGAFTGAKRKGSMGKILQANGGTLFLDEIGDMPMSLQARLLRVLQERTIMPLGGTRSYPVDIALICATNHRLKDDIRRGTFREDLYYRLNGLVVTLPPLRERTDLKTLVAWLIESEHLEHPPVTLSDDVMQIFQRHPWPGNIRQLRTLIRTTLAMLDRGTGMLTREHLPEDFLEEISGLKQCNPSSGLSSPEAADILQSLEKIEADAILKAIEAQSGNISAAARQLGVSRNTLYRKLKRN